jgi:hypothetical protein
MARACTHARRACVYARTRAPWRDPRARRAHVAGRRRGALAASYVSYRAEIANTRTYLGAMGSKRPRSQSVEDGTARSLSLRRSRRLLSPGYLRLTAVAPSLAPDYVHELREREEVSPSPPPTLLQAAQCRLAWMMVTLQGNDADLAHDLVEEVGRGIAGYDHWTQHSKLQQFTATCGCAHRSNVWMRDHTDDGLRSQHRYGLHSTFRPTAKMWDATQNEGLNRGIGWFSWGMATFAAGLLFEGDTIVSLNPFTGENVRGACNGVYTVLGERNGCPVLHCSMQGTYCFRIGYADHPVSREEWQWMFTFDDPRLFARCDMFGDITNDEGEKILPLCEHVCTSNAWPVGRREWEFTDWNVDDEMVADDDPVFVNRQCTVTVLSEAELRRRADDTKTAQKLGARQSVDGIRAITVSGFGTQPGTGRGEQPGWAVVGLPISSHRPLNAVRQDGCYVRQTEIDDGCPHYQNEWGHHLYFLHVNGTEDDFVHGGRSFWTFETDEQFHHRNDRDWPEGVWQYALSSGALIAGREMRRLGPDISISHGGTAESTGADEEVAEEDQTKMRQWFIGDDVDWRDLAHDVHAKSFSQASV